MANENLHSKCVFENIESLSQINLEDYIKLYNELKVKYGEHMVKVSALRYINLIDFKMLTKSYSFHLLGSLRYGPSKRIH